MIFELFRSHVACLRRTPHRLLVGFCLWTGVAACLFIQSPTANSLQAQEIKPSPPPEPSLTEMSVVERVTASTDKALKFLVDKKQQHPDGSWDKNPALNALAMLAFLARGHTPGRGPYRDVLERGKRYILENGTLKPGYQSGQFMYEHGLTTLLLAEMYGMDPDPEVEEGLRKAVNLIVKCQSKAGGWRYQPNPSDQDLSVTVMQIVALRAANNAEIPVPAKTIEKAIAYVKSCAARDGGFGYQAGNGRGARTTAAGVLSLQLLDKADDPDVPKALDFLNQTPVDWNASAGNLRFFYYFHYYAIQANYQAGGQSWNNWHPRVRELLLKQQKEDGSWDMPPGDQEGPDRVGQSRVYYTAMASLVLDIYMHFLPAYQR